MTQTTDLHDWLLCSIELGRGKATLSFQDSEKTDSCRLVADGVRYLVCDDLREGNIVLSVDIGTEYITDRALKRLLQIASETLSTKQEEQMTKLRTQLQNGELQFIRITPSYGAELVMVTKSFTL